MTIRSIETRLAKLESIQRPDNSRFLIWYQGDPAPAYVTARHLFPVMADAIIAEWQSDNPLPANRWIKNFKADLSVSERRNIEGQLPAYAKSSECAGPLSLQARSRLLEMTDTELWFEILKVTHEPRVH